MVINPPSPVEDGAGSGVGVDAGGVCAGTLVGEIEGAGVGGVLPCGITYSAKYYPRFVISRSAVQVRSSAPVRTP
jgi:hypothetical protein